MSGGTKIFLAVFGLLLILLIVYYGFLGGVGADQVTADNGVTDPLAGDSGDGSDSVSETNQSALAQHENRPLFNSGGEPASGDAASGRDNPFGLAAANENESESTSGGPSNPLFRSPDPSGPASGTRDPLLPTPQPVNDPLNAAANAGGERPLVQPHQPRRPQTTTPGGTPTGSVTPPRSNAAETVRYFNYTVQANDTLSGIALDWFKDATKWDLIVEANPGIDPDFIREGTTLRLPPKSAVRASSLPSTSSTAAPRAAAGPRTHIIRSGDTLSYISQQYYGTQNRWRDIYNANRRVIGGDPDTLHAGDKLVIPE